MRLEHFWDILFSLWFRDACDRSMHSWHCHSVGGENRRSATLNFSDSKTHCVSGMVKCKNMAVTERKDNVITKSVVKLGCRVGGTCWTHFRERGVSLSGEAGLASLSQIFFLVLALGEKSIQQRLSWGCRCSESLIGFKGKESLLESDLGFTYELILYSLTFPLCKMGQ